MLLCPRNTCRMGSAALAGTDAHDGSAAARPPQRDGCVAALVLSLRLRLRLRLPGVGTFVGRLTPPFDGQTAAARHVRARTAAHIPRSAHAALFARSREHLSQATCARRKIHQSTSTITGTQHPAGAHARLGGPALHAAASQTFVGWRCRQRAGSSAARGASGLTQCCATSAR